MRTLHLYEFEWMDKSKVIPENVLAMGSNAVGIRKLACSTGQQAMRILRICITICTETAICRI